MPKPIQHPPALPQEVCAPLLDVVRPKRSALPSLRRIDVFMCTLPLFLGVAVGLTALGVRITESVCDQDDS